MSLRSLTAGAVWTGVALGLLLAGPLPVSGQLPPDEEWRALETSHFRVTYPAALEELAGRAGQRAERAYAALSDTFLEGPPGHIELVLTDHEDTSNGFANVVPWKRITIYARPPMDGFALSYFDDWIDLVVIHELAHIFHLDRTGRLGSVLRGIFGRVPSHWPLFPELAVPDWTVEGLATYYESALTHAGRGRGSYHEMVLRTAVGEEKFERIDQASGESPEWPGGSRPYVYGSLFFEHLVELYGPERMGDFVRAVGGQWVPYRLNSAAKRAFGVSFSGAWLAWTEELAREHRRLSDSLAAKAPLTRLTALTTEGQTALYPAVSPDGSVLAFSRSDGRTDPQIRVMTPGSRLGRKLTRTNGVATFSWSTDGRLLFSQAEFVDPYRWRRDLYLADSAGVIQRVTRGARLTQPHASPDGVHAVAIQEGGGTNRLVRVDLGDGTIYPLTEFEADEHWAFPRWSPNGGWISAIRWRPGSYHDLVLLDASGKNVREITSDRAVDSKPAWSPSGRWLLWSSDRTGISNVFAVEVNGVSGRTGPVRQVTNVLQGVTHPEVDPSSSWIFLSAYHAHGWQIERMPFDPASWFEPFPTDPRFLEEIGDAETRFALSIDTAGGAYRPWRTLLPRYWLPIIGSPDNAGRWEVLDRGYGAWTSGGDVVGRHEYSAWFRWRPDSDRTDGRLSYSFAGLGNPILSASFAQSHDALGVALARMDEEQPPDTLLPVERERSVGLSVFFPRRRWRDFASLTLSAAHVWEDRTLLEMDLRESSRYALTRPESRLGEAAASISFSNVRSYLYSVSEEKGLGALLRLRVRRDLNVADSLSGQAGWDRGFTDLQGRIRLYASLPGPGFANHVLALRVSGGAGWGPGADASHFDLGGAAGRPETVVAVGSFGGSPLFFPLRGYGDGYRSGRYAWSASGEYRFPIILGHRGLGVLPLYLDRLSGALFLDAGNAWGPELAEAPHGFHNPRRDPLASFGAELQVTALPLWTSLLTMRIGLAVPLSDRGRTERASVYFRLGPAF